MLNNTNKQDAWRINGYDLDLRWVWVWSFLSYVVLTQRKKLCNSKEDSILNYLH